MFDAERNLLLPIIVEAIESLATQLTSEQREYLYMKTPTPRKKGRVRKVKPTADQMNTSQADNSEEVVLPSLHGNVADEATAIKMSVETLVLAIIKKIETLISIDPLFEARNPWVAGFGLHIASQEPCKLIVFDAGFVTPIYDIILAFSMLYPSGSLSVYAFESNHEIVNLFTSQGDQSLDIFTSFEERSIDFHGSKIFMTGDISRVAKRVFYFGNEDLDLLLLNSNIESPTEILLCHAGSYIVMIKRLYLMLSLSTIRKVILNSSAIRRINTYFKLIDTTIIKSSFFMTDRYTGNATRNKPSKSKPSESEKFYVFLIQDLKSAHENFLERLGQYIFELETEYPEKYFGVTVETDSDFPKRSWRLDQVVRMKDPSSSDDESEEKEDEEESSEQNSDGTEEITLELREPTYYPFYLAMKELLEYCYRSARRATSQYYSLSIDGAEVTIKNPADTAITTTYDVDHLRRRFCNLLAYSVKSANEVDIEKYIDLPSFMNDLKEKFVSNNNVWLKVGNENYPNPFDKLKPDQKVGDLDVGKLESDDDDDDDDDDNDDDDDGDDESDDSGSDSSDDDEAEDDEGDSSDSYRMKKPNAPTTGTSNRKSLRPSAQTDLGKYTESPPAKDPKLKRKTAAATADAEARHCKIHFSKDTTTPHEVGCVFMSTRHCEHSSSRLYIANIFGLTYFG